MSEQRFWKLYRQERAKLGTFRDVLKPQQIVHAARMARKRIDKEKQ